MSDEDDKFVSLAALYFRERVSAGALATAIEQEGVWGWDRFDRFGHFKKGAPECDEALESLARQVAAGSNPQREADLDPLFDPFCFYGWMARQRPDFGKLSESRQPANPRHSDAAKIENTDKLLIGALIDLIAGKMQWKPHPDFKSRASLIQHIAHQMQGYPGLSVRNLETRFAAASRALTEQLGR